MVFTVETGGNAKVVKGRGIPKLDELEHGYSDDEDKGDKQEVNIYIRNGTNAMSEGHIVEDGKDIVYILQNENTKLEDVLADSNEDDESAEQMYINVNPAKDETKTSAKASESTKL